MRRESPHRARPGNALILVSAILVLLTLIAAAYLGRMRSQRIAASSIRFTVRNEAAVDKVLADVSREIAGHLFVRPIHPEQAGGYFGGDSAGQRLQPSPTAIRYGVEGTSPRTGVTYPSDRIGNTVDPRNTLGGAGDYREFEPLAPGRFPRQPDAWTDGYNFAPYQVMPWTNWPDYRQPRDLSGSSSPARWAGPAANAAFSWDATGNPIGNPGFGDTRWLRSSEPVRASWADSGDPPTMVADPNGAFFSHWPHLTWLPTPANGYRVVPDISDIEGHDRRDGELNGSAFVVTAGPEADANFFGGSLASGMVSNRDGFGTPYEQWLANLCPDPIPVTANSPEEPDKDWVDEFVKRRNAWFTRDGYQDVILGSRVNYQMKALPNFIRLDDPLGIGRSFDPDAPAAPASDEFIGDPKPTPRNIVARTFCDADGDGYTDSLWFLAPVGTDLNLRTVVGVSVIDNAAMVDMNVATRFDRRTTTGFTPADLALVTSEPESAPPQLDRGDDPDALTLQHAKLDTRVGLLDNPRNFMVGKWADGDPRTQPTANPAGLVTNRSANVFSRNEMGQVFDPYTVAGLPTQMQPFADDNSDNDGDVRSRDGTTYLWRELGVRARDLNSVGGPQQYFWLPMFQGNRREGLIEFEATSDDDVLSWEEAIGPSFDRHGPGSAARPDSDRPMFDGGTPVSPDWQSYLPSAYTAALWNDVPPLVRETERTRWFQAIMRGEYRAFAPFKMGLADIDIIEAIGVHPFPVGSSSTRDLAGIDVTVNPFGPEDEAELRRFHGSNDSSVMSRLELALGGDDVVRPALISSPNKVPQQILRSTFLRGEGGIVGQGLTSAQLVRDIRRKITVSSGQRNELMPPWLWTGRPYLRYDTVDPNVTNQNATLWLGLHPESPGPRDEDGDGRLSEDEREWGVFSFRRVTMGNDPNLDGVPMTDRAADARDSMAAIRRFEIMNRKLDLRQPLLITERTRSGTTLGPASRHDPSAYEFKGMDASPTNPSGPERLLRDQRTLEPRMRYAYSPQEERRAMLEFAREVRQRLRPALRTHTLQRNPGSMPLQIVNRADLPVIELLGPTRGMTKQGLRPVSYGSYSDRFPDQLRLGLDAKTVEVMEATDGHGQTLASTRRSIIGATDIFGNRDRLPWRSAWATEAMTASLAANITTWRSRPTMVNEPLYEASNPTLESLPSLGNPTPLRPVWQPILPNFGEPKAGFGQPAQWPRQPRLYAQDYESVTEFFGSEQRDTEPAPGNAIRAVDPSRPDNRLPHSRQSPAVSDWLDDEPNPETAELVFPGNEKHPFLTECFVGWVYPATTTERLGKLVHAVAMAEPSGCAAPPSNLPAENQSQRYVALVNGRIGTRAAIPDQTSSSSTTLYGDDDDKPPQVIGDASVPITPDPSESDEQRCERLKLSVDTKRNTLNKIRTPVIVVQVANPWNEPIRLCDFAVNIFGTRYEFPPFEIDENGVVLTDADNRPVPLMLNPGSELAPATATVYLIAHTLGNPANNSAGPRPPTTAQSDLEYVARWDPLFRRRWLDYFDLYEYLDRPVAGGSDPWTNLHPSLGPPPWATSPIAWGLYGNGGDTKPGSPIPASKLLNAMAHPNFADLSQFRRSLTRSNLRKGITLVRRLRDPSSVRFPAARLSGGPLLKGPIFHGPDGSIPTPDWQVNGFADLQEVELVVDRFDADSSFDHFSSGSSVPVPYNRDVEQDIADLATFRSPLANLSTNLVSGGRFWAECARITLPPLKWLDPFPTLNPQGQPQTDPGTVVRRVSQLLNSIDVEPSDADCNVALVDALDWQRNPWMDEPATDTLDLVREYSFDEPSGDERCFPPPTSKQLVRAKEDPLTCCFRDGSEIDPCTMGPGLGNSTALSARLPACVPGIMLGQDNADPADYFLTWTRVARAWSRNFKASMTVARSVHPTGNPEDSPPYPQILAAARNLPVWQWSRQLVRGSFEQVNETDGRLPPNRLAPRFVFGSRTEPDTVADPLLSALRDSKDTATGEPPSELATAMPHLPRRYELVDAVFSYYQSNPDAQNNDSVPAASGLGRERRALGDLFRADPASRDPDFADPDFLQVSNGWIRNPDRFGWLTSPVWAPLPTFRLPLLPNGDPRLPDGDPQGLIDFLPELVFRKPTAFNCISVVDPSRPERLYYGDPGCGQANPTNTAFRMPTWLRRIEERDRVCTDEPPPPLEEWADPVYPIHLADKGGRLVDHNGRLLPLRLNGTRFDDFHHWTYQALWNSMDRFPHEGTLQMLHKDDDFEQLGELLDVFVWGPAYQVAEARIILQNPGQPPVAGPNPPRSPGRLVPGFTLDVDGDETLRAERRGFLQLDSRRPQSEGGLLPARWKPGCRMTFAEAMTGRVPGFPVGEGPMINRLQSDAPGFAFSPDLTGADLESPRGTSNICQWSGTGGLLTPYAPNIPWALRVFDAFTLDGSGAVLRYDWRDPLAGDGPDVFENASGIAETPLDSPIRDGSALAGTGAEAARYYVDRPVGALLPSDVYVRWSEATKMFHTTRTLLAQWEQDRSPMLAGEFTGLPVKGLINVNTAPLEVLRTLPHMTQMVYDDSGRRMSGSFLDSASLMIGAPRSGSTAVDTSRIPSLSQRPSGRGNDNSASQNPAVMIPEAISIYRAHLDSAWLLDGATARWRQARMDPSRTDTTAAVASVNNPYGSMPTYVDRGQAVPAGYTVGFPLAGLRGWASPRFGGESQIERMDRYDLSKLPTDAGLYPPITPFGQPAPPNPGAGVLAGSGIAPWRGVSSLPGFSSIGELLMLVRTSSLNLQGLPAWFPDWQYDKGWSVNLAGLDPYRNSRAAGVNAWAQGWLARDHALNDPQGRLIPGEPLDARLATDRQGIRTFEFRFDDKGKPLTHPDRTRIWQSFRLQPDSVFGDSEEQNLLFKGISNLITTRSDVFTVYVRVRTVKQDPNSGLWNGMDPELIVDDSRYVMGVDRTQIERPTDLPRITFLEKIEN